MSRALPIFALIAATAFTLPLTATAQKFQNPTQEELTMTSDPKAPSASAVFLERNETTDNFNHFIAEYARIKVLNADGLRWAEIPVPIAGDGRAPIIEARTIHADGKIIPLTGAPSSFLQACQKRAPSSVKCFTMPDAQVGSILEYRWTLPISDATVSGVTPGQQEYQNSALASAIPFWDVQQDIFIHKEHFYYDPLNDQERNVIGNLSITHYVDGEIANYLLYSAHLPAGAQVQLSPKRDYSLDLQDVPAYVQEPNAPPASSSRYAVRFYYTPYLSADVFWSSEGKRWSQNIDHAAGSTSDLKAAAAQITAGAPNDDAKARKLYDAAQALTNTVFSPGGTADNPWQLGDTVHLRDAQTVWAAKSGSPNEIALVYLALARAAGLQASAMAVADRRMRFFDPGYLSLHQLPALLVVVHENGKDVFLDPGQKFLPYGQLHWAHTFSGGLLETASGTTTSMVTPANDPKQAIRARLADVIVDAHGTATGTLKILMNGPSALHWRQVNLTAGSPQLQSMVGDLLHSALPQGITSSNPQIRGLGTPDGFVEIVAQVSGQLGHADGKQMRLPGFFFAMQESNDLLAEKTRTQPIAMHYAGQEIDNAVFHLPPGIAVESAPQNQQLPWPGHAALVVTTQPGAGVLNVKRIFAEGFVLLPANDFSALQDFYQKVVAADQQQVVLSPASGVSGN